jgi:hypothetical protein
MGGHPSTNFVYTRPTFSGVKYADRHDAPICDYFVGRGQLKFSDDDIFAAVTCRLAESATVYPTQRSNTFQALAGTPLCGKAATWREQFLD